MKSYKCFCEHLEYNSLNIYQQEKWVKESYIEKLNALPYFIATAFFLKSLSGKERPALSD
jgi:hypothetical protein